MAVARKAAIMIQVRTPRAAHTIHSRSATARITPMMWRIVRVNGPSSGHRSTFAPPRATPGIGWATGVPTEGS